MMLLTLLAAVVTLLLVGQRKTVVREVTGRELIETLKRTKKNGP